MVAHSALTTTELHEPKGADAASVHTVYVADGAGSGAWAKIDTDNLDTSSIFDANGYHLNLYLEDISTAETVYIPITHATTVQKITTCLQGTITGSDATITARNAAATSMGTITVATAGSAGGDIDTLSPGGNNTVVADSFFTIETDGASSGTVKLRITVDLLRTA